MCKKVNEHDFRNANSVTLKSHIISAYSQIDLLEEQLNDQVNQFQQLLNQKDFIISQLEQNSHGKEKANLHIITENNNIKNDINNLFHERFQLLFLEING